MSDKSINDILHDIQVKLSVPKNRYNKFGNYNYRNAEDIVDAVKLLLPVGVTLVISDEMVVLGDRFYIKAIATISIKNASFSSAGWAREPQEQKGMSESQITGAASSYARKYALNGLFAIDDGVDADSQDNAPKVAKAPKAPKVDNSLEAKKLNMDIERIFQMNLAQGAQVFKAWWGASESKADRARLKSLDEDSYNELFAKYKAAVEVFIKQAEAA